MKQDVLKQIIEKSHFYKNNFRLLIRVLLISVCLNAALLVYLFYQNTHQYYQYLAINNNGQIKQFSMKKRPPVTEDMVVNWVSLNIHKLYSIDFLNYKQQIMGYRNLFTDYGWQSFNKAFASMIKQVADDKIVARAALNGIPLVTAVGNIGGIPSWQVQVPIIINYSKYNQESNEKAILKLTIQENSDKQKQATGQNFGIIQIIQSNLND